MQVRSSKLDSLGARGVPAAQQVLRNQRRGRRRKPVIVDVDNDMLYWADGGHEEEAYLAAHELSVEKLQFSDQRRLAKWIRT